MNSQETLEQILKNQEDRMNRFEERIIAMDEKLSDVLTKINSIQSETRARYYDMQNLAYAGHQLSTPGLVSTAVSVGRSPRRSVNSYDTFR